ncbi:hypothetical protein KI387_012593, partial [Taxus chinensis]
NTIYLTPLQLESILTDGSTSQLWLVEFRALWSSRCVQASQVLSNLSLMYPSKNLSFGLVDLGRFPNAASKFGITLGANMGQLPTYILFENAVEVSRIPEMDFVAKAKTSTINKDVVERPEEVATRRLEDAVGHLEDGATGRLEDVVGRLEDATGRVEGVKHQ